MADRYCHGLGDDGPCDCLRFISVPDQDPITPHLCRDCGHKESSHLDRTLSSIQSGQVEDSGSSKTRIQDIISSIKGERQGNSGGSSSSSTSPTIFTKASKEANSGLHALKGSVKKGRGKKTAQEKLFQVGEIILCVKGIAISKVIS